MSFARDFHLCTCGHKRENHSNNFPRTRCLANPECKCEKFVKAVRPKKKIDHK